MLARRERLGEDVGRIVVSGYEVKLYVAKLYLFACVMIVNVDVFRTAVVDVVV